MKNDNNKAVGYVRCSTEQQEDSPEQQKIEIEAFAKKHSLEIIDWYVDFGKSGTTFDMRPEFQRLRKDVESGHTFSKVICYDESRWGRAIDSQENGFWRYLFKLNGVTVVLVKTSVDPKNEFAPMFWAFEGIQASSYSKKLSETTLRGALNNKKHSNGGTAPYGFGRVAVNLKTGVLRTLSDGEWCISGQEKVSWALGDAAEVEVVRFIFEERAKGLAYVQIAAQLNQKSVPCPRRGRWKNKDQKWSGISIKSILENPAYCGTRVYNRNSMSKIVTSSSERNTKQGVRYPHWKNPKENWTIEEGAHDPIVTKELWERANMVSRNRPEPRSNQHTIAGKFLLSGLITCSKCGFGFHGQSTKAKEKSYERYVDSGWQAKRVCDFLAIPKARLEEFVLNSVLATYQDANTMADAEAYVQSVIAKQRSTSISVASKALVAIKDLEQQKANVLSAVARTSDPKSVDSLLKKISELDDEIEARQKESQSGSAVGSVARGLEGALEHAKRFVASFEEEYRNASASSRKLLLRKCVSQVMIDRDRMVARVLVREFPAVDPLLEEGHKKTAPTTGKVVSAASSGGRT